MGDFSEYLNGQSNKRRAPKYTITVNEKDFFSNSGKPASANLEPGCYKIDRDFVAHADKIAQVRKGRLTDSASAPEITFGIEKRTDKDGFAKGIVRVNNRWVNSVAPDQ